MKTKNKVVALFGISIVLCSLFLVALPATTIAAEQDDFVLSVYGNANEDDTIDMRDLTYVKLIFFGKKPETELADAKYDGKINPLDFIQIKLIIVGKEKELTIVEPGGHLTEKTAIVTVNMPVKRIISSADPHCDAIRTVEAEDKVVGIGLGPAKEKLLYPVMSKLPTIGQGDCEAILNLKPDIVITSGAGGGVGRKEELEEKLKPHVTVVSLGFNTIENMVEEIMILGYILDKRDEAREFIDFYQGHMSNIKSRTKELSDDEKPRVFLEMRWGEWRTANKESFHGQICAIAGGSNIAADLAGKPIVDPEWILEQNPDIIVKAVSSSLPSGYGVADTTGMKELRDEVMNRPGWENIKAVKDGKVYLEASDIDHGPQHFIVVTYIAKWFHPDIFEDLDPKAIHQEYLDRFQRIDYNIYEHGVFVYPEPS